MKCLSKALLTLVLALVPALASAQLSPVVFEAESGAVGSQFTIANDGTATYATINSTIGGGNPTTNDRVITYSLTFPNAGVWELYARVRVGPATFNDDSMFYANGFGVKSPTSDADWILANGLAGTVGFTVLTDKVTGGGVAGSGVWKWVKLSAFDGGEAPISFTVPAGALTQTFQITGREDGLWIDKLAFGPQGVFFTVFDLDNGLPGTTVPPPPPFTPPGPPMATGKPKFVGGVSSPPQDLNLAAYFNQVTPENAGKWGSVEGTRDVMNWTQLDNAYHLAKDNGFPFRFHTLIWGQQQPPWIASLPPDQQRAEIVQWYAAVAARYPDIDFIDVVNEPLHNPPTMYLDALGGAGATGWDWVLEAFRLARQYFPNARLGLNDFSITNSNTATTRYIQIIDLLEQENLIDTIGEQGHAFSTRPNIPMSVHQANLDRLAATGLPIYITEFDVDGPTDDVQLADYQRIFPAFWEHPAVRGITLWGYRPGHWRSAQGAYIVLANGAERPAMVWLQDYVRATALAPWVSVRPTAKTVTVGDSVSFGCHVFGADALAYQWQLNGNPISGNPSAATPTLTLTDVRTAAAGIYTCVVTHAAGSTASIPATLAVNKAPATVTLAGLNQLYDGTPRAVIVATTPAGVPVAVTYDGVATPPTAPGSYAIVATIVGPDYFGPPASGTLVVSTTAVSRHAPTISGRLDGSIQLLLPENTSINGEPDIAGDLLVPGMPSVVLRGEPRYGGTIDGVGSASPSGYTVSLRGEPTLRHVVRATDPVPLQAVATPPAPAGTVDVVLESPGSSIDFSTLRNLTVRDDAGAIAVPPGTYGRLTASDGGGFTLGTPGATEPEVYNLQGLTLRDHARLEVVGPVVLNVGSGVVVSGQVGNASAPGWLALNISAGGLTLNDESTLVGYVLAPAGTVTVTDGSTLRGGVAADRLVIRGGAAVVNP